MQEELKAVEQYLEEQEERQKALLHDLADIFEEAFQ